MIKVQFSALTPPITRGTTSGEVGKVKTINNWERTVQMIIGARLVVLLGLLLPLSAMAQPTPEENVRCMAQNLYWEARGEGEDGMLAVGWVVLNRITYEKYPNTVCGVVSQGGTTPPCEWSWYCDQRSDTPTEPKSWAQAQDLAKQLLTAPPEDPTFGALWFHHERIEIPRWLKTREPTAYIGKHIFYK